MPELCEWIVKLVDKMKEFYLSNNQITSVGASMLFDTLEANNSCIKEIRFSCNPHIDDKCMKSLGEYIKSNKSIETIWLYSTSISDASTEILAPYLDSNTTFKQLYLNCNKGITDKSKSLLMKMIESSCIEYIGIGNTSITQINNIYILLICNKIKNGSTSLKLIGIEANDGDLIQICEAMKKYGIDKLKEINLEHNKITSKGASVLFDTLKECNSIVSNLNLSENQLDDECMKQLGEYLQNNEHVEQVRLGYNKITDKGIEILSEYLIGNATLKELNLFRNEAITDVSVPYLIEMVKKTYIIMLDISWTLVYEKKQEIKEALSIPIEEREIQIKSNTKSAAKIQSSSPST